MYVYINIYMYFLYYIPEMFEVGSRGGREKHIISPPTQHHRKHPIRILAFLVLLEHARGMAAHCSYGG
jgi:hypothetical protein